MKLHKQEENEVLAVYDTWLNSYLNGDIKTYDSYLDKEYRFIGSTSNEEFLNKKDTTNFLRATADQLAGKTQIRNSIKTVEKLEGLIFITDLFDAYFLNGTEWAYYGRFRFTSALRKKKNGWRFVYQHFSNPDAKAQEGETLGTEQITKENQELRDAIKRRTIELERKTRELQIEASLQRVRTVSMSMQNPSDLSKIGEVIFGELKNLGFEELRNTEIIINQDKKELIKSYYYSDYGVTGVIEIDYRSNPILEKWAAELKEADDAFAEVVISEKEINAWRTYRNSLGYVPDPKLAKAKAISYYSYAMGLGALSISSFKPLSAEQLQTLQRFRNVFNLSYQRYVDIKQAEAQTREAQIELSLERIRAQAMAMRESADLLDIVVTMRTEFLKLGHVAHYFWHMRWLPEKYEKAMTSGDGTRIGMVMELPRHMHGDIKLLADWEKSNVPTVIYTMDADAAIDYVDKMVSLGDFKQVDPNAPSHDDIRHIGGLTFIMARTTHGEIGYSLPGAVEEVPQEDLNLLVRFAGAFDLAHKRFEDLKKSEKQAREVQIELALEKVRSRTMAMQHSNELPEAANVLFLEIENLGVPAWSCGYNILSADKKSSVCIMSSEGELQEPFVLPLTEHESLEPWYNALVNDEEFFVYGQDGEDLVAHYNYMKSLPELQGTFEQFEKAGLHLPACQFNHLVRFNEGFLLFITYEAVLEAHDIFKRFGKVFEQTYTRFLDLQKAEAQAREAQIEAALERVRSRSMAMHKSEELADVIAIVSEQLQQLKIRFDHVSFAINSEAEDYHFWTALYGKPRPYELKVPYLDNPIANRAMEVRAKGLNFYQDTLTPEENREWLEHAFAYNPAEYLSAEEKAYVLSRGFSRSFALMPNILLAVGNYASKPYSDEDNEIIKRFAAAFEQSYTRFLDLQKAEAQARESQIEAALERVRAKSMAMHKSEELADLSLELVQQVQALGVATWFCAFNIYDDPQGSLEWGSNGQGTFPRYRTPREGIFLRYYEAGKRGETLLINEIGEDECPAHYEYLCTLPGVGEQLLQMKESGVSFPASQIDHVAFFKYGYILFITYEPTPQSHDIFKRFAKVFEQTYTRFLDLQKAEELAKQAQIDLENLIAAKKKTDETLTELKATQSQLIQSEKMASLGELTAGIAHEIQNPLNFVNNFSEVSNELIDEMNEEMDKGDIEEAKAISGDVKQNLEKILHHGRRADAIVKGMLQHSRSSSGQKEPTDINALADEYLRLAYHGLRAKDKTFNAMMKTEFGQSIGNINLVPQDIGRVILNLITNAFYAVNERSSFANSSEEEYVPTVWVSTKKNKNQITISVKDNGNGIPKKVLDKIFQPFFTTKPTGQGTGLGLSLSYDIIKAHGGTLDVKTKEGKGSEFIINLPIT